MRHRLLACGAFFSLAWAWGCGAAQGTVELARMPAIVQIVVAPEGGEAHTSTGTWDLLVTPGLSTIPEYEADGQPTRNPALLFVAERSVLTLPQGGEVVLVREGTRLRPEQTGPAPDELRAEPAAPAAAPPDPVDSVPEETIEPEADLTGDPLGPELEGLFSEVQWAAGFDSLIATFADGRRLTVTVAGVDDPSLRALVLGLIIFPEELLER